MTKTMLLAVLAMHVVSVANARSSCQEKIAKVMDSGVPLSLLNQVAVKSAAKDQQPGRYIGVIDFGQPSTKKRFYVVDLQTGEVESHRTSHGRGSADPDHPERAVRFSNSLGSQQSALGLYRVRKSFSQLKGRHLIVDGLDLTNNNAATRGLNLRTSSFVSDGAHPKTYGRSEAFCVPPEAADVLENLRGSLILAGVAKTSTTQRSPALDALFGCSDQAGQESPLPPTR